MNTQQLKDKILQLAIQGKLVNQDLDDEPAIELLLRIKQEKEQLIKDKEIKKNKELPPIANEEKPFDIPKSWQWVRLGEVSYKLTDGSHNPPKGIDGPGYPMLSAVNINSHIDFDKATRTLSEKDFTKEHKRTNITKGDLLLTIVGTIGRTLVVDTEKSFAVQRSVAVLNTGLFSYYLKYVFTSPCFYTQMMSVAKGTAQLGVYLTKLSNLLIPTPPINEQKRIVKKIDQLFTLIDTLEGNKEEMLAAIEETRNKILEEALKGNLVEQDPNDEPAEELLKRIKQEKKQLIKEKKIKKTNELPPISDDEKPFDIPDSWEWVRLGDISERIHYGYTASANHENKDILMLRITDIQNNRVEWENVPGCSITENDLPKYLLNENDLLFARTGGTVGKTFLYRGSDFNVVFASYLIRACLSTSIFPNYLKYFTETQLYWQQLYEACSGTGQPNVNSTSLGMLKLPIPSFEEQKRIVQKIDEIMTICDDLQNQLLN